MAIKIVISNLVGIKVKGSINDAAGIPQPFDFSLTCKRLDAEQIKAKIKVDGEMTTTDFMLSVVTDWSGVKDDDGSAIAFSEEAFRQLSLIPGLSSLMYATYMSEVGAKEKN